MEIIWEVDIGDEVVCDFCNADYTESDKTGGLMLGSYAVCPDCVTGELLHQADSVAYIGEPFKDFVIRHRTHSTCGVATL